MRILRQTNAAARLAAGLCLLAALSAPPALAEYALEVHLPDTLVTSGADTFLIPIYVSNPNDTIAGFAMLIETDHPELLSFNLSRETEGTLVEDWDYLSYSHVGGDLATLRIVGLAESGSPPATYGIPPQMGYTPLMNISVNARDVLDTISFRTAQTIVNRDNVVNFGFSDPNGVLIGTYVDSVLDTAYWNCLVWDELDSTCLEWEWLEEPINPGDSFLVYWRLFPSLDLEDILFDDGSITISGGYKCGDVDGDGSAIPNIADLVFMVTYMFQEGEIPPVLPAVDVDGNGSIDIADVIWLVSYMFSDGPPPVCGA